MSHKVNGVAPSCVLCGQTCVGEYDTSLRGEVTCSKHDAVQRCVLCKRPRSARDEPGWRPFSNLATRCPSCVAEAVNGADEAGRYLPQVLRQMAELDIRLRTKVRVMLVDPALMSFSTGNGGMLMSGITHRRMRPDGIPETVGVDIATGLTPTHFGATVAHELVHCWLLEQCPSALDQKLEEGVCELFAGAWLRRRRTRFAAGLWRTMEANPDPIYGEGYRMVRSAVLELGVKVVLDHVCRYRSLP